MDAQDADIAKEASVRLVEVRGNVGVVVRVPGLREVVWAHA